MLVESQLLRKGPGGENLISLIDTEKVNEKRTLVITPDCDSDDHISH
jgi:hypothetical protein